jgi:Mrp family chromosome partitioning ATPase
MSGAAMSSCSSCSGGDARFGRNAAALFQDTRISSTLSGIRYKLFIMSGKGGVGKSSVTVNAAAALADKGFSVGILDVDIHGPSVPRLLNLSRPVEADEGGAFLNPVRYNERLAVISMDSLLQDRDSAVLWRGPKKTAAIRQFISDVNWGELDFLLIDSPPGTGDEHMTVLKTIPDALCIVVTTPQEISLADVRKAVNFLQYAKANVLGVVENMSGLHCPHCRQEIELFKRGGGRELAEQYRIPFLGGVPLDPATVAAADKGLPVVFLEGDFPAKRGFLELADNIVKRAANSLEAIAGNHS